MKEKKDKTQITIRVDTQLRNAVLEALEAGVFPECAWFTDVIERGMRLAIAEWGQLSTQEKQVRAMVAKATKEQQRLVQGLLVAMAEPLIDPQHARPLVEEKFWEFIQWYLTYCNTIPEADACIEYYASCGKKKD